MTTSIDLYPCRLGVHLLVQSNTSVPAGRFPSLLSVDISALTRMTNSWSSRGLKRLLTSSSVVHGRNTDQNVLVISVVLIRSYVYPWSKHNRCLKAKWITMVCARPPSSVCIVVSAHTSWFRLNQSLRFAGTWTHRGCKQTAVRYLRQCVKTEVVNPLMLIPARDIYEITASKQANPAFSQTTQLPFSTDLVPLIFVPTTNLS